jgi:hypothetical protein
VGEQIFMMKSEVVSRPSIVSDDLVHSVEGGASEFQNFHVNFCKFHTLFSIRLLQFGLAITSTAQDGFQKCSRVCTKRREWLPLALNFLERYHKYSDEFLNHIV